MCCPGVNFGLLHICALKTADLDKNRPSKYIVRPTVTESPKGSVSSLT